MGQPRRTHTLLFLEPGHFHAALTLREPHPRVDAEIFVYGPDGPELRDFLALIERFNRRAVRPTCWRPVVDTAADPLRSLVTDRRGDVVVLAGRNDGKARLIRRLHDEGFAVLADKPWLVNPESLDDVRASLAGWPLAMEIMTGRHEVTARVMKKLVDEPAVFGAFLDEHRDRPAIEFASVHHLEKLVDGAPLRRPWWFFDVRVQGNGAVDIPTHLVDQTQWLLDGPGATPGEIPELLSTRGWSTRVPVDAFARITGSPGFPAPLDPFVDGDALGYCSNAEIVYRLRGVTVRLSTRWDLAAPPGAGDSHHVALSGTRAVVRLEQGEHTAHRRRVFVEPGQPDVELALVRAVNGWQGELSGTRLEPDAGRLEVVIPDAVRTAHETHFALVLDDFLRLVDARRWPGDLAARTLAKYTLLARAARQ